MGGVWLYEACIARGENCPSGSATLANRGVLGSYDATFLLRFPHLNMLKSERMTEEQDARMSKDNGSERIGVIRPQGCHEVGGFDRCY